MTLHIHLVTVGAGILTNFLRSTQCTEEDKTIIKNNLELIKRATPTSKLYIKVYNYLLSNPRKVSPEINAMWNYINENKVSEVYLYATNTGKGLFCSNILRKYFYDKIKVKTEIIIIKDFGILFEDGLINLLDKLSKKIFELKRNPNIKIYLNATGGFKPENAILYVIASMLKIDQIYYIHENFKEPIKLPLIPLSIDPSYLQILKEILNYQTKHGFMPKTTFLEKHGHNQLEHLKTWNLIIEENGKIKLKKWTKTILKTIK